MATSYTYVLGVDFSAVNIDLAAFQTTIAGSSIASATVQYLIRSGTSVAIWFNNALIAGDITTLNGLVAAYVYVAPTSLVYVDTTTVQQVGNKQLYTSNTVVDTTTPSKALGFSLSGMSTSTQLTLSGTLTSNRTYTFPEAGANSNVLLTNSTGTQTIATGVLAISNTAISTSSSTGALQVAGGLYSSNHYLGGVGISSAGTLAGPLFNVAATTITATNTSDMAFVAIQQPTLANSVVSSTTTNAYTLYVGGAPLAGTNETITNAYAARFAAGKVRIDGTLQLSSGATNGFVLTSDASGNASWAATAGFAGFADGTVSAPGAYWASQTNTGLYRPGSGQIYIALAGTNTAGFTTTNTFSSVSLNLTGTGSSTAASATLYSNPASTAFSAANNYFFNYFNTPTTTGSTTGTASTVFIANAPANATTAYALNVAAGNSLFGGNVTLNAASAVLSLSGASSSISVSGTALATSSTTGSITTVGGVGITDNIWFGSNITNSLTSSLNGILMNMATLTYTDSAGAGTIANVAFNSIQQPTLASTNARTTTNAITKYLAGAPIKGTNETFTNAYGLYIDSAATTSATVTQAASLYIVNAPTVTSGTTYALLIAAGNSQLGGNLTLNATSAVLALSGASSTLTLANTTASTSSSTGALQVAGGAYFGANSLMNANLTLQGASAVLALSGASSTLTLANTTQSTSTSTGAIQSAGGMAVKNIWLGGVSFSTQAVSTTGPILNVPATTITANNTTDMAFLSIQQPTLANSVAASTTTNASTLYIANAPAAGTNETITNAYALNVAAGKVRVGGTLQIPTGATSGYVLTSDASGNASWSATSGTTTLAYFNALSNGTFSTNATVQANITTMTLTPTTAGTYWVIFTCNFTEQKSNAIATFDLALNGSSISNTTTAYQQNNQQNNYTTNITCVQAFNGSSDTITARVSSSSSSSTVTITYRSIYALRMSA